MKTFSIPKKITKKVNNKNGKDRIYTYELDHISKYVIIYNCLETGTKESFQKKDFIKYINLED